VVYPPRAGDGPVFLLIRDPYENWGLPKGHLERGETPEQAALREVAEETGIQRLELREPLGTIDWFFREGPDLIHKYCHFFLMETDDQETRPQLEEGISECLWLPWTKRSRPSPTTTPAPSSRRRPTAWRPDERGGRRAGGMRIA
jgi:ADP-ribose pyrophosphatase YjhB (NUDIX family)